MNQQDRIVAEETRKVSSIIPVDRRDMIAAAAVGAAAGLVTAGAYFLLERFVFDAVMCRQDTAANCADASAYAMVVAMVIGGLVGLISLVQTRAYRPLLVVLAVVVGLWGFETLVAGFAWYWTLLICALLFAAVYALFSWIARIRSFALTVAVTLVLVVVIRYMLVM